MSEAVEQNNSEEKEMESEEKVIELTPEQLESILTLADEGLSIPELLEKEMINNRTLYLSEEINLDTINHIIMLIHKYNRDDEGLEKSERMPIILYFDCVGGELTRGFSLVSTIESSVTPVVGVGHGMIASMALPLFLSTDYRLLSRFGTVLYHELRAASDTETLREMQNKIAYYERLQDMTDNYIVEKTTIPLSLLKKKRKRNLDWFISLEDLTKYKFYDELID